MLDANLLENIRNPQNIHAVILGGWLFARTALDNMVERAISR
jgi:hypothetical protein